MQLLHVVEYVPVEPMSDDILPVVQIDQELMRRAQKQIVALAHELRMRAGRQPRRGRQRAR